MPKQTEDKKGSFRKEVSEIKEWHKLLQVCFSFRSLK